MNLSFAGDTVIIAVSGGADSVALTVALHQLKQSKKFDLRFVIAHFNHDLRGEDSENDEQFVRVLAEKLNFELALGKEKILEEGNLEQNARRKRYEFLYRTAENLKARIVLTAHTMNDQAETFLINLIRGSGIQGLAAIKPITNLEIDNQSRNCNVRDQLFEEKSGAKNPVSNIQLVRPLLSWAKREDTENFCHLNKIEFRFDSMNEDLRFRRVRIRKVLLPLLRDFNPKIVENLAKTAELLQGEISAAEAEINPDFDENLNLKNLKNMPKPLLYKRLRIWLKRHRGNLRRLELKHIEAVERLIFSTKSGKIVELPGGDTIFKSGGVLQYKKTKVEK